MPMGVIHLYHQGGRTAYSQLANAFHRLGHSTHLHVRPLTLYESVAQFTGHDGIIAVLVGEHAACLHVARQLRSLSARVRVLGLLDSISAQTLTAAMQSGVDTCWHVGASPWLVAKMVNRWLPNSPGGRCSQSLTSVSWKMAARGWVVRGPGGRTVELTSTERALFLGLCNAHHHRMTHSALWQHIDPGSSSHSSRLAARRLSVLVSRLRQKFSAAGLALPIRSVHGFGYELSVELSAPAHNHAMAGSPLSLAPVAERS